MVIDLVEKPSARCSRLELHDNPILPQWAGRFLVW
jgi:hypothetical protein